MASLLIFFGLWVRHLGWVALDSDEAATVLMANMRLGGIHRRIRTRRICQPIT